MAQTRAHTPEEQALLDCMIQSWYATFKDVTFRSVLLPLPQEFLDWLVSDGLYLPEDSEAIATRGARDPYATEDDYQDWGSGSEEGGGGSGSEAAAAAQPEFPELLAAVRAAIAELGGRVLPKLSWSCPKDAAWLTADQTAACTNPSEVLLLLKASDRVAHDIAHAFDAAPAAASASPCSSPPAEGGAPAGGGPPPVLRHTLALRKWYDLRPEREFRCFVVHQRLIGVSQRDLTQRFPALPAEVPALRAALAAFHAERVAGRFPQPTYTYDVYVTSGGRVRLVDFNPAGEGSTTAPLLFTWRELLALGASGGGGDGDGSEGSAATGAAAAAAVVEVGGVGGADADADGDAASGSDDTSGSGSDSDSGSDGGGAIDFRVVTEPVAMRPNKMAYGVPFDFADTSEGSALSQLAAAQAGLDLGGA